MRALTHDEIRGVALFGGATLKRWVPADVAHAVANNAASAFVEEPEPLSVDLVAAVRESLTQALRVLSAHAPLELADEEIERAVRRASVVMESVVRHALGADVVAVEDEADKAVGSDGHGEAHEAIVAGHGDTMGTADRAGEG